MFFIPQQQNAMNALCKKGLLNLLAVEDTTYAYFHHEN